MKRHIRGGSVMTAALVFFASHEGRQLLLAVEAIQGARISTTAEAPGPLFATVSGKEVRVAEHALKFWILDSGKYLAFSDTDGAGGYENEGESLRLYSAGAKPRKILAEQYAIDDVRHTTTSTGKEVLLVLMRDGGLGASHLAVVDPARGEVVRISKGKLIRLDGDTLTVGFFREEDWELINAGRNVPPTRSQRYDLKALLTRPVLKQEKIKE